MDSVNGDARARAPRRWLVPALLVLAAWMAFAAMSSAHFFLVREASASLTDLATHIGIFYLMWAALTPIVLLAARRFESATPPARWTALAAIAPVAVAAHGALYVGAMRLVETSVPRVPVLDELRDVVLRHGSGDLATYAVIIGLYLLWSATRRARERELAASQLAARLARADLELLRWQLQPHFLFNVLNTVSTLVLKEDSAAADRAVSHIARYLRSTLAQRADAFVTLDEELALVDQYVEIESLRFDDVLRVERYIANEARAMRVPSMTLQPLVENAIHHGLDASPSGITVRVRAWVDDGRLLLAVSDGAPASAAPTERPDGFGLHYVRERLAHFYGDDARLTLAPECEGMTATISVPLESPAPRA